MAAWRYEISLLVLKKYFTRSLRSLVKYFSTLEEKFHISARPCISSIYFAVFRQGGLVDLCWRFSQGYDIEKILHHKIRNSA